MPSAPFYAVTIFLLSADITHSAGYSSRPSSTSDHSDTSTECVAAYPTEMTCSGLNHLIFTVFRKWQDVKSVEVVHPGTQLPLEELDSFGLPAGRYWLSLRNSFGLYAFMDSL